MKLPLVLSILLVPFLSLAAPKILYHSDFSKMDVGQAPADFLVLDGDFAVRESDGKKVLELPGAPLDTFGLLFGGATNSGICVGAQIYGTSHGRRAPSFGVGLGGVNGYRLIISAAKGSLEIFKGDASAVSVPYPWKSGSWTLFRFQIHQVSAGTWKIEGKAWNKADAEPGDWTISLDEKTPPHEGRCSIWGSPYSGTPIRFDDLQITAE